MGRHAGTRLTPRVVLLVVIGCVVAAAATALAVRLPHRLTGSGGGDSAGGGSASHHGHMVAGPSISPDVPASNVLTGNQSFPNGFTVPAGQVWEFARDVSTTVSSRANIVVLGVLRMRPANPGVVHTLRFTGIDERRFVGGGMRLLPSDVGLWVLGAGQLDIAGSPRAGWNRTGTGAGWQAGDDIRVAPTARGDSTTFARFTPGSTVPSVSYAAKTYRSEVLNLTRNVRIEGTGDGSPDPARNGRAHIFIQSSRPQSIRYATLRHMAPRRPDDEQPTAGVLGRYALHFHMAGNGSRGSLVEGVVVRDSGGHAFVPHASHGITFRDTIAFNTFDHAYWWDPDDSGDDPPINSTSDLRYEHAMAALTRFDPEFRGYTLTGFMLGEGRNLTITDSVGVGIQGNDGASGFHWPATANGARHNTWAFTNNVAHNNRADGIFTWQNDANPHRINGFVAYRNGDVGVDHGAYVNNFQYENLVLFGNGGGGIRSRAAGSGRPQTWRGIDTDNITLAEHTLGGSVVQFNGVTLRGRIVVDEEAGEGPTTYEFRNVRMPDGRELALADFVVRRLVSRITVIRRDGSSFVVR